MVLRNLKLIMMVYLSDCKFGDRLEMRNGKMAIYVGKEPYCASYFSVMDSIKFGYGMLTD